MRWLRLWLGDRKKVCTPPVDRALKSNNLTVCSGSFQHLSNVGPRKNPLEVVSFLRNENYRHLHAKGHSISKQRLVVSCWNTDLSYKFGGSHRFLLMQGLLQTIHWVILEAGDLELPEPRNKRSKIHKPVVSHIQATMCEINCTIFTKKCSSLEVGFCRDRGAWYETQTNSISSSFPGFILLWVKQLKLVCAHRRFQSAHEVKGHRQTLLKRIGEILRIKKVLARYMQNIVEEPRTRGDCTKPTAIAGEAGAAGSKTAYSSKFVLQESKWWLFTRHASLLSGYSSSRPPSSPVSRSDLKADLPCRAKCAQTFLKRAKLPRSQCSKWHAPKVTMQ